MKSAMGVEISHNKKTGPVSATYAGQESCPPTCPFLGAGCYGESGRVGIHTAKLNKSTADSVAIAEAEAEAIDGLSGLLDLRVHVVGGCRSDAEAEIVGASAGRFMARRRDTDAWTYAHAWKAIKRASWGVMSVLASCHTKDEVKEAMSRGYAASITTAKMPEKAIVEDGITYVPCVEQTKGITCVECRLCFDDVGLLEKKIVIVFELHTAAKKAFAALERAYKSWGL
tara:strand:+ start:46 stop:729 length:684 start_codon:yes stop_codon:yes gene_type:complete